MIHLHYYEAALLALIIIVLTSAIGYDVSERNNESKIAELKTELKQAKAQTEVLEENQVIVYYADSWGGEWMIKVYFGNDESKEYIGEFQEQIVAHFALFMTMLKMLLAGKKFIIVSGMKMVH